MLITLLKSTLIPLVGFKPLQSFLRQGDLSVLLTRETQGWITPVRFWIRRASKGLYAS
jgi:hypothetical protein